MSFIVIYRRADGKPGYQQAEDIHDAVVFVEQIRNEEEVERARIFRLEEVEFEYRPYYRVELADLSSESMPELSAADETPPPAPVVSLGGDDYGSRRAFHSDIPVRVRAEEVSVAVYLDTDEPALIDASLRALDLLLRETGHGEQFEVIDERGSFWRRSRAKAAEIAQSDEVTARLAKLERAVELAQLDARQSEVNLNESDALAKLVESLELIPRACIRSGSILLLKYSTPDGPVLLSRNLSLREVQALEKYPELQQQPETLFEQLSLAMDGIDPPDAEAI